MLVPLSLVSKTTPSFDSIWKSGSVNLKRNSTAGDDAGGGAGAFTAVGGGACGFDSVAGERPGVGAGFGADGFVGGTASVPSAVVRGRFSGGSQGDSCRMLYAMDRWDDSASGDLGDLSV